MMQNLTTALVNGGNCPIKELPVFGFEDFAETIRTRVEDKLRVVQFFALKQEERRARLIAVLADNSSGRLYPFAAEVAGEFPSITPACPQVQLFEREIYEQTGILPVGHPWLKAVRLKGSREFFQFDGDEVHEVGVGPVHAGVIEPGHFRFQCHGERILNLEISLGYQHRGIEKRLEGGPDSSTIHLMETAAGDTTTGHTLAYCKTVDSLSNRIPTGRAEALHALLLELERLANHVGDLGALAGDVGYLPTKSFCGRLRGELLNLTALICGNRFGRNILRPGLVKYDLSNDERIQLTGKLKTIIAETMEAIDLLWDNPSVLARFEHVGTLDKALAEKLGALGPAARASGVENDARIGFADGAYARQRINAAVQDTGDVFARAMIRKLEIESSYRFILDLLENLPDDPLDYQNNNPVAPDSIAVSLVEGWRGEICHAAITDEKGRFLKYKIVDPSFHNWFVFSLALRNVEISDFPLCNKSFNLSYCGFDL